MIDPISIGIGIGVVSLTGYIIKKVKKMSEEVDVANSQAFLAKEEAARQEQRATEAEKKAEKEEKIAKEQAEKAALAEVATLQQVERVKAAEEIIRVQQQTIESDAKTVVEYQAKIAEVEAVVLQEKVRADDAEAQISGLTAQATMAGEVIAEKEEEIQNLRLKTQLLAERVDAFEEKAKSDEVLLGAYAAASSDLQVECEFLQQRYTSIFQLHEVEKKKSAAAQAAISTLESESQELLQTNHELLQLLTSAQTHVSKVERRRLLSNVGKHHAALFRHDLTTSAGSEIQAIDALSFDQFGMGGQ